MTFAKSFRRLKTWIAKVFDKERRAYLQMGFFSDQSGIIRRYRREKNGWDIHIDNTKKFAVKCMQNKNRKSAAVLGSGWLLDVPIDEMSKYFEKIVLYDIRHPEKTKKKIKNLNNIELCTCDISGFAIATFQYAKKYRNSDNRPPVSCIQPQKTIDLSAFDFVFSCNILNQLDILLVDYLLQFFDLNDDEIIAFRNRIQEHHIGILPRNRSCIVVDYKEITKTANGKECSRKTTVHHPIVKRTDVQRWTWEFDTKMTYYKDKKTFFEVLAAEI